MMSDTSSTAVYRIALGDGVCRSAKTLLTMRASALEGARAATVTAGNELIVVGDRSVDIHDDLVAAVVRCGLDPVAVRVAELERPLDATGLSADTAMTLRLIAE